MRLGFGVAVGFFVALSTTAFASDRDAIITSCEARYKAPERTCACMADKAIAEFDAKELVFFEAIVEKGVMGAMSAAPAGLTQEEANHVAGRVSVLPAECVNG